MEKPSVTLGVKQDGSVEILETGDAAKCDAAFQKAANDPKTKFAQVLFYRKPKPWKRRTLEGAADRTAEFNRRMAIRNGADLADLDQPPGKESGDAGDGKDGADPDGKGEGETEGDGKGKGKSKGKG